MPADKAGAQPAKGGGPVLLPVALLVGLLALAVDALHLQLGRVGWGDMIAPLMDPADDRLRDVFTGLAPVDRFLKVIIAIFEPLLLLERPEYSLYGLQFGGQAVAIITVFLVQGLRETNRGNVIRL